MSPRAIIIVAGQHLQPRAPAGCGARGTSLTCEASARLPRHDARHRAERGPVACSASLCGPDHAGPATTHQLHQSDRLPNHTTPSRIVTSSGTGGGGKQHCRPERGCHSPHAHERRLSSSQIKPSAAAIITTTMLHGVEGVASSLGGIAAGFGSGASFGPSGCRVGSGDSSSSLGGGRDSGATGSFPALASSSRSTNTPVESLV